MHLIFNTTFRQATFLLLRLLVLPLVLIKVPRDERGRGRGTKKTVMYQRHSESIDKFEDAAECKEENEDQHKPPDNGSL